MKQKLYTFLLTALLGLFGMNAWAQNTYEITDAQDLVDFANAVNGGETSANAVVTADIDLDGVTWVPIGNSTNKYTGTFDGGGFTIKNFSLSTTADRAGLFGYISGGAVVKNFTIEGSITSNSHQYVGAIGSADGGTVTISNIHSKLNITCSKSRHGGILGSQTGTGTVNIDRCTYSGKMTVTGNVTGNFGGIVGLTNNSTSAYVNITNCLFDGEIDDGTGDNAGGIVGYTNSTIVVIKNCLSKGAITAAKPGQFFGQLNGKNSKCEGVNYYVAGNVVGNLKSGVSLKGTAPVTATDAQLASGEICFLLNESVSGGTNWFQTLVDDDYPFPYNGDVHDPIYANGNYKCDGVTPKGSITYGNTESSTVDPHTLGEGICSGCGIVMDEDYIIPNANGTFEIGTPAQLRWFAAYVNQINPAVDAILTADIDLDGVTWVPIGNASAKYTGIFDGQGHAITNFSYTATSDYNGLFGFIDGNAVIKNFRISGTLTSDGYNYNGLVGQAEGNSKVNGIYSNMNINVSNFKAHSGGIVGGCTTASKILIENCEYAGTLTHSGAGDCQAGILGYTYAGGVKNCIFSGTIIGENNKYGGILGYCKAPGFQGIQNCLSIGKIVASEGCTTAAAIIANYNGDATANVRNNYYCLAEGSTTTITIGNKASSCEAPVEVTAEQLASGEVAYKLGIAFRQNIGTDATPVLNPTHNVVVEITAAGYATLYVPDTDVTIPEGVTAYTAEFEETWLKLNAVDGIIPAQTAVILKGEKGIYEFAVSADEVVPDDALGIYDDEVDGSNALVKGWAAPIENNVLKGSAEDIDAAGKYVLAKPEGEPVCFYLAESGIIRAGKAYLELEESEVKAFYFLFSDDATGINEVNGQWSIINGQSIYNLAGQRIQKMQKGINIVGGKKILF